MLHPLAQQLGAAGLHVEPPRAANAHDLCELDSSWARRLGVPNRRPAWLLRAQLTGRRLAGA